jgi:hypothetical protein
MTAVSMIVPIRVLLALDYAVDTDWKAFIEELEIQRISIRMKFKMLMQLNYINITVHVTCLQKHQKQRAKGKVKAR